MRSPSPSNPIPKSAFSSRTRDANSARFSASSGLASWFGKFPSGVQYILMTLQPSFSNNSGANNPATPFPASITTFKGRASSTFSATSFK